MAAARPHILVTNDDGIESRGIEALLEPLRALGTVSVVAPDGDRSGVARAFSNRREIGVREVRLADGSTGYAVDGTPVDCVRLAGVGLVDGNRPDVVVSGINLGANAGDDVTYSGTVGAAFEGALLGWGAIAVSQYLHRGDRAGVEPDLAPVAAFTAALVPAVHSGAVPRGVTLNVNAPRIEPRGARVAALGRRRYNDQLDQVGTGEDRRYRIYDAAPSHDDRPGSDLALLDQGYLTVTPLHLDLTDRVAADALSRTGLPPFGAEAGG